MSNIIYQNRASTSSYDSETTTTTTTTTTLKLKVAATPPLPTTFNDLFFHHSTPKQPSIEKQSFYTHPLLKNSSFSRLSAKSLELCTEYLGSETGTEYSTSTHLDIELQEPKRSTKSLNKPLQVEKIKSCRDFPPPLSTLCGSKSLQVRRYREEGRLIIEAVEVPIMRPCLHAERSNGRLRLHANKEQKEEDLEPEKKEEQEEEEEEEEDFRRDKEDIVDREMINVEMGIENFGRMRSRCNNGIEALCSNWKSALWVATS